MHFSAFLLSAIVVLGVAATDNCNCPCTTKATSTTMKTTTKTTSSTWKTTTKPPTTTPKTTASKTATSSAPASTNNGQVFVNKCTNLGISVADCTQLLNIAALNGNNVNVGGNTGSSSAPGPGSVNNGQKFLNQCKNVGISILDCAQLLNLAILNGNNIDISLAELTDLVNALGLNAGALTGLLTGSGGLVKVPAGLA